MTGDELRKLREAANLTQEQAAAKAGKSRRTWQYWELHGPPDDLVALGLRALLTPLPPAK
jgi:transcriptional regulator with XRE-family HTH domain